MCTLQSPPHPKNRWMAAGWPQVPGSWCLPWVVLAGFRHSHGCGAGSACSHLPITGKKRQTSASMNPSGMRGGVPKEQWCGMGGAHPPGIIKSSSTDSLWSALRSFLLQAGTGEQHHPLQPAPTALLLE